MQLIDGRPVYAATDLVGYLACEHLAALERAALAGLLERPHRRDPELEVIRKRGFQHERRYLDELRADGRSIVVVDPDAYPEESPGERLRLAAAATIEAMAGGADVVYQATFFDGSWRGHADFLLRRDAEERPSRWGPYHYEVADTKLARHVKAGAVLQMCSYVDQLTGLQEVEPELMHVVLGGASRAVARLRVDDYMAYYRAAKARFLAAAATPILALDDISSYPDPVDHCEVCRWAVDCQARRRADDHLSLVAGISSRQRKALAARNVTTLAQLGDLSLPVEPPIAGTSRGALQRVRDQAAIQLRGRRERRSVWELIRPAPEADDGALGGLADLPAPSPGDLFFDIEGDPYALDEGLDYLFGVIDADGTFTAEWSRSASGEFDLAGEKQAFERVIDAFMARLAAYPDMHIYHYAAYEVTALRRLMGRHATREDEVDRLLRGRILVDLYRVVRQGVRASVEGYSIKNLEALYGFTRQQDLRDAGSSIVAFEEWLELGEGDRPAADHLERIERYNLDDVVSNRLLRDWLEERRSDLEHAIGRPIERPRPPAPAPPERLAEHLERVAQLGEALTRGVAADPAQRDAPDRARWLLTQLLSWHRREDKSFWWLYFHLKDDLSDEERVDAGEPIGMLEYVGVVDRIVRSEVHRYRFPPQDHQVREGGGVRDPATGGSPGTVVAIDNAHGTIDLKRAANSPVAHPRSVIPYDYYDPRVMVESLLRVGDWVAANGIDAAGPYRAARDLLLRRRPRLTAGGGLGRAAGESDLEAARRLALELDHTTLAIQGPPGSGKTYTGARMALDLAVAGKRIGVTATSHKVIANFLRQLCEAADQAGITLRIGQKGDPDEVADHPMVVQLADNGAVVAALAGGDLDVVGGTAWLWAREEMVESVDVLFVDEAGQISLANTLAVAPAGRSLVLLGDPQQLEQPLRGIHPPGADRSALAHVLDGESTMRPDLGFFLGTTWRLHPALCAFTSPTFYDGRLEPERHLAGQELRAPPPVGGAGVRLLEVAHHDNDSESAEEAEAVGAVARALVESGSVWIDQDGQLQVVTWADVLIVAPYNAQVARIQAALPGARVGTVDKFQGQEAPISIYSMTTSSPELAPRGMGFLYSRNRLNVATSRARCVAVVACSPDLLRVRARTPEQMRLANALCRLAELAPRA